MRVPKHLRESITTELRQHGRPEIDVESVAAWLYTWEGHGRMTPSELAREIRAAVQCIDAEPETTSRLIATW